MNYVSFPPRTGSKPLLTVRKLIKNPVLSLTLLQIYCIGLIELITHLFWVWTAICDPTVIASENLPIIMQTISFMTQDIPLLICCY